MARSLRGSGTLIALVLVAVMGGSAVAEEIMLAAAAGFRRPITEIAAAYEKESGHKVLQVYGHMGQVIAQARESGKVGLVCGDRAVLEAAPGLAWDRMTRLGFGKLVVAYRKGLTLARPEDLGGPDYRRIGIPDQANAIYGKAGRQFLERARLGPSVDSKLITVATVPQVTSYLVSGEVDAGFINATDAIGAGAAIGGFVPVDPALYEPVEVACGSIGGVDGSAALEGLVRFLATAEARRTLDRYGL